MRRVDTMGGDIISCRGNITCNLFLILIPIPLSKLSGFVEKMNFPVPNGKKKNWYLQKKLDRVSQIVSYNLALNKVSY